MSAGCVVRSPKPISKGSNPFIRAKFFHVSFYGWLDKKPGGESPGFFYEIIFGGLNYISYIAGQFTND